MMQSKYHQAAETAKRDLDRVSSTFCKAKWKQVTMHLHNGLTHSCHHPPPHKVPLAELSEDPRALHNTVEKKNARKQMLGGEQPAECAYCWNVENSDATALSDRHYKSGEWWADDEGRPITVDDPQLDINPTYVEVSFSNVCNFACSYCSPQVSSAWVEDVKHRGPYELSEYAVHSLDWLKSQGMMPIPEREENPYVEAFWKWWPDLYPSLKVFRITGGEPLLSKHTWRVLDYIEKHPRPDLEIAVNTNLGVPFALIERLVEVVNRMVRNGAVKTFEIYTSVDSWGEDAAYIRGGMDWAAFEHNLRHVLSHVEWPSWRSKIVIMCTYNLLSIPNFRKLLDFVLDWRRDNASPEWKKLWLDVAYLRYPDWQTANLASPSLLARIEADLVYMRQNERHSGFPAGFQDVEIDKLQRLYKWAAMGLPDDVRHRRLRDLRRFFAQYDQRRGKDFRTVFPDLVHLMEDTP